MKKLFFTLCTLLLLSSTSLFATDYEVSGAGSSDVNGTYVEDGTYSGKPEYAFGYYRIRYDNNEWAIMKPNDFGDDVYYTNSSTSDNPPETGWEQGDDGASPVPTVTLSPQAIPFTDGFEDGSLQSYWTTGGSVSPAVQSNTVYNGGHALCFNTPSGDNNYLEIELAAETDPMLTFSYYLDYAYNLDLSVDIYTNGTWTNDIWEDNDSYDEDARWMQAEIDLSSYDTESGSFKLRFNSSSGEYTDENDFIYLDEVIAGGPSNPAPNNELVNISSGDLSWDHGLNVSTYDVKFGEAGNMTTVSSGNSVSGTSANYSCNELDYKTFYQWQIIYYKEDDTQIDGPVWSFYTKFSGTEEGTEANPFIIDSEDDLLTLSLHPEYWGDNYKQEADISFNVDETQVDWDGDGTADWDTEDQKGFSPIGNEGTSFMGSYDGNSYTISGLFINRPSTDYVGLFGNIGYAYGPQIINLGLLDIDITGNDKVGALIGFKNGYTLYNCYVSSGSVSGNDEVGGLIGYCGYADMERCYTNCSVSGNSSIGGLIGITYTGGPEFIKQSYSLGDVGGTSKVGGLIGNNYMIGYQNCYSRGNVTRTSGSEINFGGFIGINSAGSDILYSYSTGAVYSSPGNLWGDNDGLTDDKGFLGEEENPGGHYTFNYTANFFDSEVSGQSSSAIGATGLTTTQMHDIASFTDETNSWLSSAWDFVGKENDDAGTDDYWGINYDGQNNGYPFLTWQDYEHILSQPGLWTGADPNDNNWNTPGNWDDGQVPGTGVDVTIPDTGNDPVISAATTCQNITIENNGTLTINSSQTLNVSGDFTLNDGGGFSNNGTLKFSGAACELSDNRATKSSLGDVTVGN